MTKEQITNLVAAITDRVVGNKVSGTGFSPDGTGPVTLQIGFVNNIVQHDGIVIIDAPSAITDVVMDWIAKEKAADQHCLVKASAGFGGLFIR